MMHLVISLMLCYLTASTIATSIGNTATLTTHSDNVGTHSISNDGGASWTVVGTESNWWTPFSFVMTGVSADTKIRVSVLDEGFIGGFIATVSFDGQQFSTTNPLGNGHWKLVSASDGDTALVFHEKTAWPWGINTAEIASDAFWVWNEGIRNTLVFEFDFDSVITSPSDSPVEPTAADIDDLRVAVMNKIDTFGNEDDGPESKPLIGSILRLVFHDCSGPFNDGTTAATNDNSKRLCDGCIDLDKGDHGGLQSLAVEPLEEICSEFAHIMNRADCWAAVGNVATEYSHSLDELNDDPLPELEYWFGREECPLSPNAITDNDEGTEFPLAHLGWDAMIIFFTQNLGFSFPDTVAILGAHTVGAAHKSASGFEGKWTEDSFAFNNEYYVNMLDAANQWDQDFGTSNGFPQWNNDGRTDGDDDLLMLNADLGLIGRLEDHGFDEDTGEVDCRLNGFTLFGAETCGNEASFDLVNTYAQDNGRWLNDYVSAWNKLVTRNQPELTRVDATDFVDLRGDVSVFVEHPQHNGFPRDLLPGPEPNTWTLTLSGKDLAILILVAINLVTIVAVYCQCVRAKGMKPTKYQVVNCKDSEMDSEVDA